MIVLSVVAHPDDEVLGAGATLARMAAEGHEVHILILAEGVTLRHGRHDLEQARDRCRIAAEVLGASGISFGGFAADGRLMADTPSQAVVAVIERTLSALRPQFVLTHHGGDIHADHRLTHQSVAYCAKVLAGSSIRELLTFEVLSSSEQQMSTSGIFVPDTFIEVGHFLSHKCKALEVYADECQCPPQPRNSRGVRLLAAARGLQVGVTAAEAFALDRRVLGHEGLLPAHGSTGP